MLVYSKWLRFLTNICHTATAKHTFLITVPYQPHSTLVPYIDTPLCIHTEDRSVRRINKTGILSLLRNSTCNILSNTDNTNHIALLITTRCGVQKNVQADTGLGDKWELKVGSPEMRGR